VATVPPNRIEPAVAGRPFPKNTIDIAHLNGHRRQDGYAAPDAEDRADEALLLAAAERGFVLATRCLRCGHWVTAPSSVSAHMGPVCRAKAAD
jgi:hypothetical protein